MIGSMSNTSDSIEEAKRKILSCYFVLLSLCLLVCIVPAKVKIGETKARRSLRSEGIWLMTAEFSDVGEHMMWQLTDDGCKNRITRE